MGKLIKPRSPRKTMPPKRDSSNSGESDADMKTQNREQKVESLQRPKSRASKIRQQAEKKAESKSDSSKYF